MRILAGIRADGEVFSAVLMQNAETPGLGKEAENPGYMEDKFIGTGDDEPVPTTKSDLPPEEAEAVSGSTITFMGIADALAAGSRFVEERL
jgi:electron transport complex protein RnfG